MRITRASLLLVLLCCLASFASGQQKITGRVVDKSNNEPIIGASVQAVKSTVGTVTDASGHFTFQAPQGTQAVLIKFLGYKPLTMAVPASGTINAEMELDEQSLEQVVVVGYGTQKKANLTGAVAVVDVNKTFGSRPITDISRGLQGATPGLTITSPSGDLGTDPAVRLRGLQGSLNSNGAKPLILLDNVEIPTLQLINPADVESISVLKDAASTSIYGARAAWGVILITSKAGKRNTKNTINYNNNFSWATPTNLPTIASGPDGATMALAALQRSTQRSDYSILGITYDQFAIDKMRQWDQQYGGKDLGDDMVYGRDYEVVGGKLYFYRSWDAGDKFMKKWTPQQKHDLSFSGGNEKTAYNVNLGYLNQQGVLKANQDSYERYNANISITSKVKDWLDIRGKIFATKAVGRSPFNFGGLSSDPIYYLYRWPKNYPYGTIDGKPIRNAITEVQQAKMNEETNRYQRVALGATGHIMKGWTVDMDYVYSNLNYVKKETGGSVTAYDFWGGLSNGAIPYSKYTTPSNDIVRSTSMFNELNTFKLYTTYAKDIKKHSFKVIAGTDMDLFNETVTTGSRKALIDPNKGEPNLATGEQLYTGSRKLWSTAGYFGRINYVFANKWLLELNARLDGSSRFPTNDQWGFFPSASVGYVVSDEKFMNFTKPVLDFLKLRASYGEIGSQDLNNANQQSYFLPSMNAISSNWLMGSTNMTSVTMPTPVPPTVTWETVSTLDFGFDARMFKNKLGVTFDWYRRTVNDMIVPGVAVPSTFGDVAPKVNAGQMYTQGWELAIDFNHQFENGLGINVMASLSDFKEIVTKYPGITRSITANAYAGKTLGEIWGYETDRLFQFSDFVTKADGSLDLVNGKPVLKPGIASQSQLESGWFYYMPGDVKYKDLDGDGKVWQNSNTVDDPGDKRVIGNSTPRYQYGFQLGAQYKGFDFSMFIQGVGKRELWPSGPIFIPGYKATEAWYAHQLDYWTPTNTNAFYPSPIDQGESNNQRNFLPQSRYLLNMAYMRMKNMTLGYTLPANWLTRAKIQNVRVYVTGENMFEFTKLDIPIDPEVDYISGTTLNTFGRVYPYRRSYAAGIQITL
ncbi:TonB-linked SusC/RagA family outer membrane protein [Chitinophaga skermanii]|uniref:TonB-linked SusC/RagA family outer membrane protein n=1 Tax=Chitinophaga skermanii TaxID=331697 RepID=A0A327Q641_9BACT|nr:TonB-dependent receptor [Chitinophaga skermanii]RAI99444.1 TonB-linked SusC/RagA family outer membrane protein [Chitinophaga skermanii]